MSTNIDLKELERQAFRSNFADGLWDIFLGLLLLQMAVGPALYRLGWSPVWILLVMAVFVTAIFLGFKAAKRQIVLPRFGLVQFGAERQRKQRKLTLVYAMVALLGVVVLAAVIVGYRLAQNSGTTAWGNVALLALFGLFLITAVLVFSFMAYNMDYTRAYLYGWFYGLAFPLNILMDELFSSTFPLGTVLFSTIMIIIGLVMLTRFLRKYPMPLSDRQ
ncbi:MAG: hypothetical protein KC419_06600 [Anaerolineales bacterium]|nr:hypothetical protein [Anaerolineales bacterium]